MVYYVKPQLSNHVSLHNRGFKDGYSQGKERGIDEGYHIGYREGYKKGIEAGKVLGIDSLLTATKAEEYEKYVFLVMKHYHLIENRVKDFERAAEEGKRVGRQESAQESYSLGFKDGYEKAFDLVYGINLAQGETIDRPVGEPGRMAIDYEKVARLLNDIGHDYLSVDFERFSNSLYEIHTEILSYLVRRLSKDLSPAEETEIFQRYEEIHSRLARSYYRRYFSLCRTRNRNYENKSFYDYRYYNSADIFLNVVEMGISAVVDVTLTYAKSNPQYAATKGFEVMGHSLELLLDEVMLPLEDLLLKQALVIDYDQQIPVLVSYTQQLVEPIIAETRIHKKKVNAEVQIDANLSALVTLEIETIVNIGFYLEDFTVQVDHNKQSFHLMLSTQPRLLEVVKQDYKFLSAKVQASVPWPGGYVEGTLSEASLQAIFEANKDMPASLPICQRPLSRASLNLITPSLIKVMEPCISLPVGCYEASVFFGSYGAERIIKARCR
jgi:hypothetical protein